jgi:hypothetical protein
MTPMPVSLRTLVFSGIAAVIAAGCSPSKSGNSQVGQQTAPDSQRLVAPLHLGEAAARPASADSSAAISPRRPSISASTGPKLGTIPVKARRDDTKPPALLTVASFLDRPLDVGQRIQITGTCLDQFHANASAGAPPVSRSDWQLTNGSQVVYVVGRMPASCIPGPATISASVAIDTTLIAGQRRPRRFLTISR